MQQRENHFIGRTMCSAELPINKQQRDSYKENGFCQMARASTFIYIYVVFGTMEFGANQFGVNVFWLCHLLSVNVWESQLIS